MRGYETLDKWIVSGHRSRSHCGLYCSEAAQRVSDPPFPLRSFVFGRLSMHKRYLDITIGDQKFCNTCGLFKNKSDFGIVNGRLRWQCKFCRTKSGREFRLPQQRPIAVAVEIEARAQLQNHECILCFRKFSLENKAVRDHCHKTGKQRGLICARCNSVLGFINDSVETAYRIFQYLKGYSDDHSN